MFSRQIESASGTEKQDLAVTTLRSATKVPTNGMARYSKIRSSSQTPHKVGKSLQKRSGMHTLAVAFKSMSSTVIQCADAITNAVQIRATTTAASSARTPL